MGFAPKQVDEMSVWQFMAALDGYIKANTAEDGKMSDKEAGEMFEWLKSVT